MSGTDLTSGEREHTHRDRLYCPKCVAFGERTHAQRERSAVTALIERLTSPEMVETLYAMLDEHGWADHYQCGWEDATPPPEGMCGKEWAERESLGIVLTALAAALRSEGEQ